MIQTFVLEPLLNLLLLFYAVLPGGFGIAIIAMTVVIRLAMWPLVKKQIHHQKAMKELQPEINKVKKKAKGDKQKESQMMMELFKEKGMNPFGSIGLALLQFPILIALLFVFRDMIDVARIGEAAYSFIHSLPAIQAILTNPGTFDPTLFGFFHMTEKSLTLAVIAGAVQYLQVKQMSPENMGQTDPNKKAGFGFMKLMPLIAVGVGSQLPSALPLYWAISSLVAVIQQRIMLSEEVGLMRKMIGSKSADQSQPEDTQTKQSASKKAPATNTSKKTPSTSKSGQSQNQNKKQTQNKKQNQNQNQNQKQKGSQTALKQKPQPNTKKG